MGSQNLTGSSSDWEERKDEFRKIRTQYGDFQAIKDRVSEADVWQAIPLNGGEAETDFQIAATRAALLAGVPPGFTPVDHWYELLISRPEDEHPQRLSDYVRVTGPETTFKYPDGNPLPTPRVSWGIEILHVILASEELCASEVKRAVQIEALARQTEFAPAASARVEVGSVASAPTTTGREAEATRTEAGLVDGAGVNRPVVVELSEDEATRAQSSKTRRGLPRIHPNLHPEVENYLTRVSDVSMASGNWPTIRRAVTIDDFCRVSGFGDDTVFGAWRRGDSARCNVGQAKSFENTLKLDPAEFLRRLATRSR